MTAARDGTPGRAAAARSRTGPSARSPSGRTRAVSRLAVHLLVDRGDGRHPAAPIRMLERHYLVVRPVEVVGDEGHLLDKPLEGVAHDPPTGSRATSNAWSQAGHTTGLPSVPPLIVL